MSGQTWVYRLVVALSGISVILVLVYLVVSEQNRELQAKVNERQQFITQSIQFGRVNAALVRALATAAVGEKDDKLRALLAQNGIAIDPKTGAPIPARQGATSPAAVGATPTPAPAGKSP